MKITIDTEKLQEFMKAKQEFSKKEYEFNQYIADIILQEAEQH